MQEESGLYWSRAERVAEGEAGGVQYVVLRRREAPVEPRFGFAACLLGRSGDFAGKFAMFHVGEAVELRGRWCTADGRWFKFSRRLPGHADWRELLAFAGTVAKYNDDFPPELEAVRTR